MLKYIKINIFRITVHIVSKGVQLFFDRTLGGLGLCMVLTDTGVYLSIFFWHIKYMPNYTSHSFKFIYIDNFN